MPRFERVVHHALLWLVCFATLAGCGDDDDFPSAPPSSSAVAGERARSTMGGMDASAFLLNEDCFEVARDPVFVSADQADFVAGTDQVLGLSSPGRVIAIPLRLLAYHRVVDMAWGARRVLVTYAPLRGTAATYWVPQADSAKGFGVAGHVRTDLTTGDSARPPEVDLLLYDGRKRSLWSQATGGCIAGWRRNEVLEVGPKVEWTTWSAWRARHNTVDVMSPDGTLRDRYPATERDWKTPMPLPSGLRALPDATAANTRTWLAPKPIQGVDDATWMPGVEASYLRSTDDVIGFDANGRAAVPVFVLTHHHVMNTRLGDQALAIAICDLCSTAHVFRPRVGDMHLTFDPAGAYLGAALIEDRQTRSRWSVVDGLCIFGWFAGTELSSLDATWTTWGAWMSVSEETRVLAERDVPDEVRELRAGGLRGTAEMPSTLAHTIPMERDTRLPAHALLYAIRTENREDPRPLVFPYAELRAADGVAHAAWLAPIVVFFDTSSRTARGYHTRTVDGKHQNLHFQRAPSGKAFVDDANGSTWSLYGRATAGPLAGAQLVRLPSAIQIEWYAWSARHPKSKIWRAPKK